MEKEELKLNELAEEVPAKEEKKKKVNKKAPANGMR